ncbi:MAG: hypothetical protein Q7K03_05750 [Dehalococcoidia bacterium]|nr:hypothetical protein [Dehalococcoidia bacterium]
MPSQDFDGAVPVDLDGKANVFFGTLPRSRQGDTAADVVGERRSRQDAVVRHGSKHLDVSWTPPVPSPEQEKVADTQAQC